jgi:hypothetical protein
MSDRTRVVARHLHLFIWLTVCALGMASMILVKGVLL